jgi:hypothetical protein
MSATLTRSQRAALRDAFRADAIRVVPSPYGWADIHKLVMAGVGRNYRRYWLYAGRTTDAFIAAAIREAR